MNGLKFSELSPEAKKTAVENTFPQLIKDCSSVRRDAGKEFLERIVELCDHFDVVCTYEHIDDKLEFNIYSLDEASIGFNKKLGSYLAQGDEVKRALKKQLRDAHKEYKDGKEAFSYVVKESLASIKEMFEDVTMWEIEDFLDSEHNYVYFDSMGNVATVVGE